MEKDGFSWWIQRLRRAQDLYDEFRIDHFRGFTGFWAVPSGETHKLRFLAIIAWHLYDVVALICSLSQKQKLQWLDDGR